MANFEVYLSVNGQDCFVGRAWANRVRGKEIVQFEYDDDWLSAPGSFSLEPQLPLTRGGFHPRAGQMIHGALGDSAPDTWGRRLMQRAERRRAAIEGRSVRTLMESDYLLGVADQTRLGALRFRDVGGDDFLARPNAGVPALLALGRLLQATERILRDEETDEDLEMIFAPGSSLGGARPKASVIDQHGRLAIAKFPKESDEYSIETWEEITLRLAERAGIKTAVHELVTVAGKAVLLSRRFDREGSHRIPFLSAMAMLGARDGDSGSYPEIVDVISSQGAHAKRDAHELYRRVAFNVLVSNVDDHLRNHGFLRTSNHGWQLSPAYDLNPVPSDLKARVLSTNIDLEEATCSIELLESAAGFFALSLADARSILRNVAEVTSTWCSVARDVGASTAEMDRMASAFEHDDLRKAQSLVATLQ